MTRVLRVSEMPHFVEAVVLASLAAALGAWFDAVWALLFVARFAVSAVRALGTVTITPVAITRRSPFGERRIAWAEVERVDISPGCTWFVFHARSGTRLSMPAPRLFGWGEDALQPAAMLEEMALERDIPVNESRGASFVLSRGT